jgi:hypothetical protein
MTFFPLTEILLYIAIFFAPFDATHVVISGPNLSMELTRGEAFWSSGPVKFTAVESQLAREENSTSKTTNVYEYVQNALKANWASEERVFLDNTTTLKKTPSGFIMRVKGVDPEPLAYTITYRRDTPGPRTSTSLPAPTINVLGAVKKPGAYSLQVGATLLDALAAAGGGGPAADVRKISIVRGPAGEKPTVTSHDATAILRGQTTNPLLLDHDTIFVPETIF